MKDNEFIEFGMEIGAFKSLINDMAKSGSIKKSSDGRWWINIQVAKSKDRNFEKSVSASVYDSANKTKKYIGNGNMFAWVDKMKQEINLHAAPAPAPAAPAITPTVSTTYPTAKATNNMQAVAQDVLFDVPVQKDTEDDLPF
jgi:hypothetical protein